MSSPLVVVVMAASALMVLVVFARRMWRRKDQEAFARGLVVDGLLVEPRPECGYHDATRTSRRMVPVRVILAREAQHLVKSGRAAA